MYVLTFLATDPNALMLAAFLTFFAAGICAAAFGLRKQWTSWRFFPLLIKALLTLAGILVVAVIYFGAGARPAIITATTYVALITLAGLLVPRIMERREGNGGVA